MLKFLNYLKRFCYNLISVPKQTAYKRAVIKNLYFSGPLSCADLSLLTEKSLPLTAKIINELIEEGSVKEKGLASSTGGRRAHIYAIRPDLMYVVSVAMDQLITRLAIIDMQNNIIGEVKKIELVLPDNSDSLLQLKEQIDLFIQESGIAKTKIAGIGIGMPGFVDVQKGINHSFLKTEKGSIVSYLEEGLDIPVWIDNDSSLIALAELRLGAARNRQNAMVINISWGIGLGMVLKGELFRGYNGFAGEFSHIPLFINNKICSCGKTGCLETETSLLVVVEKAIAGIKAGRATSLKSLSPDHLEETAATILDAALSGDSFAIELLSEVAYHIGRGVAILIHLINPELIILSGRGSVAGKLWLAPIQQAINEHCIPKIAEITEVKLSGLGHHAEILGAAALVMENYDMLKSSSAKLEPHTN